MGVRNNAGFTEKSGRWLCGGRFGEYHHFGGRSPSGTVSIGIDAPRDVLILRSELQQAANANRDSAEDVASLQTVEQLESIFSLGGAKEAHPEKPE